MDSITFTVEQFTQLLDTVFWVCLIIGSSSALLSHVVSPLLVYLVRQLRVGLYQYKKRRA